MRVYREHFSPWTTKDWNGPLVDSKETVRATCYNFLLDLKRNFARTLRRHKSLTQRPILTETRKREEPGYGGGFWKAQKLGFPSDDQVSNQMIQQHQSQLSAIYNIKNHGY